MENYQRRFGAPSSENLASHVLIDLGLAEATVRLLAYFLLRPEARPHGRELQRVLGLGGASLSRELRRLVEIGLLARSRSGRQVHYSANFRVRLWESIRIALEADPDPAFLIHEALLDVTGVTAGFIFGSCADGNADAESDVDLFVLEESSIERGALLRQLAEAGLLLRRQVNPVRYSLGAVAERLGDTSHRGAGFLRSILEGPKRWVAGDARDLRLLATAAGLPEIHLGPER